MVASNKFIEVVLEEEFTKPVAYTIDAIYQASSHLDPVLFLLSAGADPSSSIDELAKKKKKFPVEKVSMGEGQEEIAQKAIE